MALTKLYTDFLEEKYDNYHWSAVEVWECPESEARSQIDSMYNRVLDGHSGDYAPRCRRVRCKHNALPGRAHLWCFYRTMRVPGIAKVFIDSIVTRTQRYKDRNGKVIEGRDPDGNDGVDEHHEHQQYRNGADNDQDGL